MKRKVEANRNWKFYNFVKIFKSKKKTTTSKPAKKNFLIAFSYKNYLLLLRQDFKNMKNNLKKNLKLTNLNINLVKIS